MAARQVDVTSRKNGYPLAPLAGRTVQCTVVAPQHFLYFFPLPHGQGAFRPTFVLWEGSEGSASCSASVAIDRPRWAYWATARGRIPWIVAAAVSRDCSPVGFSARKAS